MSRQIDLWPESLRILKLNAKPVAGYVCAMMIIAFVGEHLSSHSALSVAQAFAAAILAIPAHLSVLNSTSQPSSVIGASGGKVTNSFVFRCIGLGILSFAVPAVIFIMLMASGVNLAINGAVSAIALLVFSALVFAKWGTMLPATVLETDKSMARASQRGADIFGYAFPRLLMCFGLLTVLQIVPILLVVLAFNSSDLMFSTQTGLDAPQILAMIVANVIGAFQIVMTAVILSRSYLQAEQPKA